MATLKAAYEKQKAGEHQLQVGTSFQADHAQTRMAISALLDGPIACSSLIICRRRYEYELVGTELGTGG
jgi:hypothetical protein